MRPALLIVALLTTLAAAQHAGATNPGQTDPGSDGWTSRLRKFIGRHHTSKGSKALGTGGKTPGGKLKGGPIAHSSMMGWWCDQPGNDVSPLCMRMKLYKQLKQTTGVPEKKKLMEQMQAIQITDSSTKVENIRSRYCAEVKPKSAVCSTAATTSKVRTRYNKIKGQGVPGQISPAGGTASGLTASEKKIMGIPTALHRRHSSLHRKPSSFNRTSFRHAASGGDMMGWWCKQPGQAASPLCERIVLYKQLSAKDLPHEKKMEMLEKLRAIKRPADSAVQMETIKRRYCSEVNTKAAVCLAASRSKTKKHARLTKPHVTV